MLRWSIDRYCIYNIYILYMYFTDPKAKFGGRGWRERPLVIAPPQNRSLHLSLSLSRQRRRVLSTLITVLYASSATTNNHAQTPKARALASCQYPTFLCTDALCPKNADPKLKNDNLKTFPFVDIKNMTSTTTKLTTTTMVLCAVLLGSLV